MYAEVLIQYGAKALDRTFTYLIPETLKLKLKKGMKVVVPFGPQKLNGFVINIKDTTDLNNLKYIISITNEDLILNEELLNLGYFVKETTLCSLIQAYQAMLPSSMKVKTIKSNYNLYNNYLKIISETKAKDYILFHPRSIKQKELLERLLNGETILKNEYSSNIINKLLEEKIIEISKEIKYRINVNDIRNKKNILTIEQQNAYDTISNSLNMQKTFLLYGVTGSGKTEVYMQLIEKVIHNGKTAILLVPEISLTTQIIERFYERFGSDVAIFHSSLSEGEKYDEYHKIMRNEVKIVVGTRSAIFMPLNNLGLIIIDEEQSPNYKQDCHPHYNAIDIALERSKNNNCPVILGSATPSLETMARALKGVYTLLTLNKRIGESKLPNITLVDMSLEFKKRNTIISELLDQQIKDNLTKKEQVMILLNRRGYSTIVTCKNCGYTFKCPHCDITLTYHKNTNDLRCHYCGYVLKSIQKCPQCHEEALTSYGLGTEKLEEELKLKYPEARIIRMDADTTINKGSHEKIINAIETEQVDIIIGTQMISKGFDFPKITLVGIINADDALNIPDFRSGERTYSLFSQASGRAGRSSLPGNVIIQTFDVDNKTLNFVKNNDYIGQYNYEMNNRKLLKYPPYYYLTTLKITSKDLDLVIKEAKNVSAYLHKNIENVSIILGPTAATMFKYNNIYRMQIILKYKNFNNISSSLKYLDEIYAAKSKVNIEIDVNPTYV